MISRNILAALLTMGLTGSALLGACNGSPERIEDEVPATGGAGGAGGEVPDETLPTIVGAGLIFEIDDVEVSEQGVATVDFTVEDSEHQRLDLDGKLTSGQVNPSFVLSWLSENEDGESTQYTAYTLRNKESSSGDEMQSSSDSGGTYEKLDLGKYRYTFGSEVNINEDREGLTHTLGVYATRQYAGVRYVATALKSWVPDGSEVKTVLDVVTDKSCNSCHTRVEFHGGARRGVEMCQLCHTESNSINPESGNTFDFQVMIHKIHMGDALPSVQEGDPYFFVGYMGHVQDYSEVRYPWNMSDCGKCHDGEQGDRWITRPAEKPCSSCHDRTFYGEGDAPEGWTKHEGGPRDNSECIVCHGEDSIEPITKSHKTSLTDVDRPMVAARILGIENTSPGSLPRLEFQVTIDGATHDIVGEPLDRIRMRVWGPHPDAWEAWSETISDATECDDDLTPPCIDKHEDNYYYYAATSIPISAEGSYSVGLDGRYATDDGAKIPFVNPILAFAVTGEVMPRRQVVDRESCNSCHGDMGFHGGSYNEPAYCLNCHNVTAYESGDGLSPGDEQILQSINLKDFIHRKHTEARYSAPLADCEQCHIEGTYGVPLADEELLGSNYLVRACSEEASNCIGQGGAGNTPSEEIFTLPPESAACVSCHNDRAALSHSETNTGKSGEACGTCHGEGKGEAVGVIHALEP